MMHDLNRAIVCALAAALFYALTRFEKVTGVWAWVCVAFAVILATGAVAYGANWLANNAAARMLEIKRAANWKPVIDVLRALAALSPTAQAELALKFGTIGVEWEGLFTNVGPAFSLRIGSYAIDYSFIEDFIVDLSDDRYLCAIREFENGSTYRNWAQALTVWLCKMGYAEPAKGNQPATWVQVSKPNGGKYSKRQEAMRALFGLDNTPSPTE